MQLPVSGAHIVFHLPMPKSWSRSKRARYNETPHQSRPDVDNLCKALMDAVYANDSCVWQITIEKRWAYYGAIEITDINNADKAD